MWAELILQIVELIMQQCPQASKEEIETRLMEVRLVDRLRLRVKLRTANWGRSQINAALQLVEDECRKCSSQDPELVSEYKDVVSMIADEVVRAREAVE